MQNTWCFHGKWDGKWRNQWTWRRRRCSLPWKPYYLDVHSSNGGAWGHSQGGMPFFLWWLGPIFVGRWWCGGEASVRTSFYLLEAMEVWLPARRNLYCCYHLMTLNCSACFRLQMRYPYFVRQRPLPNLLSHQNIQYTAKGAQLQLAGIQSLGFSMRGSDHMIVERGSCA